MTRLVRLAGFLLAGFPLLSSGLRAQDPAFVRDLATGDPVAVEAARRRLVTGPVEQVPVDAARQLLQSSVPERRLAAASILLHHGLEADAVAGWVADEVAPRVLEPLIDLLPRPVLERVVRTEPRGPAAETDELPIDFDLALRMRARALGRLLDTGGVDPELWRVALASAQPGFARAAADRLVEESWPFPVEVVEGLDGASRSVVLDALADRPRAEAAGLVAALLDDRGLPVADRLRAMLAVPAETWARDLVRGLPADAIHDDREVRALAVRASDLLTERQAERLVAAVHRRAIEGGPVDGLLPALARIGPRGERLLLGLARELSDEDRAAIVDWLATRDSVVVAEIVADALDGRYPLTPDLLLRGGGQLVTERRLGRVLELLADPDGGAEMRVAAFGALVDRGRMEHGMLEFALDPDGDPNPRVRLLLSMPIDALSAASWERLLRDAPHDTVREVMARMAEVPVQVGLERRLAELAATGVGLSDLAARVCLIAGRSSLAKEVWDGLSDERRQYLALSLRERDDDWVLAALRATTVGEGAFELLFARLVVGDRQVLDDILADPGRWPTRWLRRAREDGRDMLSPEDVDVLAARIADTSLDAAHRRLLVRWLADRPDLDGVSVLERAHAEDPDEEVRYAALRGLLRHPVAALPFRARVADAIGAGLDLDTRDLAFEVIGSLAAPVDRDACTLVARLALVAPLAHDRHELRAALRQEPVADVALLNAVWQAVGRKVPASLGDSLEAAVGEAAAHRNAAIAARHRVGRFLALLAREDPTRAVSAPVARAILAIPDLDPGFVGPASVILAEAAEAEGAFSRAADLWERAARGCLRTPPEPMLLRVFVGDVWRAEGLLPAAFLTARPHLCRARAALAAGDPAAATAQLEVARGLGVGDRATLTEIETLEQEINR